jgi:putative ABC transport system permease protein
LNETLKEGGRTMAGGARQRLRSVFVASEIALAVVLLVGAGLMLKSLLRLLQTNGGFDPSNVLTLTIVLPPAQYNDSKPLNNFYDQLKERIQSVQEYASVGTSISCRCKAETQRAST